MNRITFDHAARTRASGVAGLAMVPLDSSSLQKVESRQVKPHLHHCCVQWRLVHLLVTTCEKVCTCVILCDTRLQQSAWQHHLSRAYSSMHSDAITNKVLQVPSRASVTVPAYSFPEKFSSFSFLSLLTKAEVIAALVKVRAECNKVGPQPDFHA